MAQKANSNLSVEDRSLLEEAYRTTRYEQGFNMEWGVPWTTIDLRPEMKKLSSLIDKNQIRLRDLYEASMRKYYDEVREDLEWSWEREIEPASLVRSYTEEAHGGGWQHSPVGFWSCMINHRVETFGGNARNSTALGIKNLQSIDFVVRNLNQPKDSMLSLEPLKSVVSTTFIKARKFHEPKRDQDPSYWIPVGANGYFIHWMCRLASAWEPETNWQVSTTDGYHAVLDLDNCRIFDMLADIDIGNPAFKYFSSREAVDMTVPSSAE